MRKKTLLAIPLATMLLTSCAGAPSVSVDDSKALARATCPQPVHYTTAQEAEAARELVYLVTAKDATGAPVFSHPVVPDMMGDYSDLLVQADDCLHR